MAVSEKTALRHQKWKREILEIIRTTPDASRISVKRARGLSMDSTLALIGELLDEGLILSRGKTESGRVGRRATLLQINPDGCYFIGVRFSAGGISGVCMDFAHRVVCHRRLSLPAKPGKQDMIDGVTRCIELLMEELGAQRCARLRGIGLGAPGIIDPQQGVITRYVHISGWENVPLREIVERRFGLPTYLEHGVKCTARAVMSRPEHAASRDLLFLQMGRGVSLCTVIGGRIHSGVSYLSGEIGHMLCAGRETLESLTASDALCAAVQRALAKGDSAFDPALYAGGVTLRSIVSAAQAGDSGACALMQQAGRAAGCALSAAIMVVNPQDVILSGRLCCADAFKAAVDDALHRRCIPESLACMQLSFLPSDAQLDAAGAAMLPYNKLFSVSRGEADSAAAGDAQEEN